ncbi:MAG: hypothetical protein GX824_05410 [Clostridiales bacterium]|nr:hypothetical protein [Clostridiales bacterium]
MKKKTLIKIAISTVAVSIVVVTVIGKFFINTHASPPDSGLPLSYDHSMILLETRTSDLTGSVFNVMTSEKNTVIIYKTEESFSFKEKPRAVWGLKNYDFFIQLDSGKTFCYKFTVSDWETCLNLSVVETVGGYDACLINLQTGEKTPYDKNNIPVEIFAKLVEYTILQA